MIKNPNWQETASWLFIKRGRVESGTTGNKSKPEVIMGFKPRPTACKPNSLTTGPRRLPNNITSPKISSSKEITVQLYEANLFSHAEHPLQVWIVRLHDEAEKMNTNH